MEESFALGDAFSWFIQERCYPQATLYQISIIEEVEGATFQGDKVEDLEGIYPPVGWTLTWNGAHIASFDCWVNDPIFSWGYVMWYASRPKWPSFSPWCTFRQHSYSERGLRGRLHARRGVCKTMNIPYYQCKRDLHIITDLGRQACL